MNNVMPLTEKGLLIVIFRFISPPGRKGLSGLDVAEGAFCLLNSRTGRHYKELSQVRQIDYRVSSKVGYFQVPQWLERRSHIARRLFLCANKNVIIRFIKGICECMFVSKKGIDSIIERL